MTAASDSLDSTAFISTPLPVLHLLDAMGGGEHLWGKERVVLSLIVEQRRSGLVDPQVATFVPSLLGKLGREQGFEVAELAARKAKFSREWGPAIAKLLAARPGTVLHTHGYKANLAGRLPEVRKVAAGLVATCHGWVDTSPQLKLYNWLDRKTAGYSDIVTVPDPAMCKRFGNSARVEFVPNGVADMPPPTAEQRAAARRKFGWPDDLVVAGMLGRMSIEKGVHEFIEAATGCSNPRILWTAAGAGPLASEIPKSANLQYAGYVDSTEFLSAIDIFVQPSRTEALSLSLLEAARAKLPIVATRVGATDYAVRNEVEALLVNVSAVEIRAGVERLAMNRELAANLADAARRRFESALGLSAVHERLLQIYRSAIALATSPRVVRL